jgi:hypothetical protein
MIGTKSESLSWRDGAMAREVSSAETRGGAPGPAAVDFKKAPLESAAWDPYEVWLTRVKQPRDDARTRK